MRRCHAYLTPGCDLQSEESYLTAHGAIMKWNIMVYRFFDSLMSSMAKKRIYLKNILRNNKLRSALMNQTYCSIYLMDCVIIS